MSHPAVRLELAHWQRDTDLAARDAGHLEKLPEGERVAWRKFWRDVATLQGKTEPRR